MTTTYDDRQPPMDLRAPGAAFRNRVSNPLMFRAYMLAKMPVLGVTGATLQEITTHRCVAKLPTGRTTRNLFGQTFSAAVFAAAETASSALLVLHIRNQQANLTPEVVHVDGRFSRADLEELTLRCDDGARYADAVARAASSADPIEETFTVRVQSPTGDDLHHIDITWRLGPKRV